jgi:VIT1/CCC1 family predicted Fe2+/Mn2+ transporter
VCHGEFVVPGKSEFEESERLRQQNDELKKKAKQERSQSATTAMITKAARQNERKEKVQLDRDPLKEWTIYAAVIFVLLLLAAGRYIVSAVASDGSYLCVVILVLFVVGIAANFRGVLSLRSEYVCAAACLGTLRQENGLLQVNELPPAGIFHRHVQDLSNIARFDGSFSQDSLITLLYSRMMAKCKIVEVLSGVLVSLGLIGTIVGLIAMTEGLSSTLESLGDDGNASGLLSGMRTTMAGLGTAFYTTLVGAILGSVVLRVLNNVYTSNVDHLVSYVASTAEVQIVPRLKQKAKQGGQIEVA